MGFAERLYVRFLAVLPSVLVSSCATIQADSDYYGAADFSKFHSYAWMADSPLIKSSSARVDISPLTVRRIREAIERDLNGKSFETAATREEADFAISFTVGARDTLNIDDYPPYYRGDWHWGQPYYGRYLDLEMYTEGTLAIDIFDNATRQPVWHGWARKTITGADVDDPESTINTAVAAILAAFPPQQ